MNDSLRDLLRQGADTVERPRLDVSDLVAQAQRRLVHRRLAAFTASAAAVVLIAAGGIALRSDSSRTEPAPPAPTETPTTGTAWTPEQIRAEGSSDVLIPPTASGLTVREYAVCDGSPCGETNRGDGPRALEVTQDGRSAVFEVRGVYYFPLWVSAFDEDSVLFQDAENTSVGVDGRLDGPVRYHLLQANGTEVELQVLDDPARPAPGPDVVLIDDLASWIRGYGVTQDLYLVDDRAETLRPLDVPEQIDWWGPNYHEFLWGGGGCRVTWQAADGGFDHYDLPGCADPDDGPPPPTWQGDPFQGWLEPGRMAVPDWTDSGVRSVTVSTDYGATWQRVPIENGDGCSDLIQPCLDAIAETLRQIG